MTRLHLKPGSANSTFGALAIGVRAMMSHPWLAALFLLTTLAQGTLQGLLVWGLRQVLLTFSHAGVLSITHLIAGAAIVFGLWMLLSFSTFVGEVISSRLAYGVETESMLEVLTKLLSMSVRFYDKSSQGDLVMATYHDLKGVRNITLQVGMIVLQVSRLLGLAVVAWVISPKLAVIGLVLMPLGLLPANWLGNRITQASRRERDAVTTLYDSFLQVSTGIRVIKVNNGENRVLEQARRTGRALFQHLVQQNQNSGLARLLFELVSGLGLAVVLTVGGRDVAAGELDWQSLLSLLIAVLAVYSPMVSLLQIYGTIRSLVPNLDRIEQILQTPADVRDHANPRRVRHAPKLIELDRVSFAYDNEVVLRDVSAAIHRGETIGLVGPSGAGKSTLMALLLRLYDPTGGRILFDGVDLREIARADLMNQCAIVLQEPFLFIDTVANNIRWTRSDASRDMVMEAARGANIHDEIMRMEHGYDTVLGRHRDGRGISVGQKQRISIAAALLKNAPLLFLDEATSNLDSVSERAVQAAIERLMQGRTTFIIAHRLSTLRSVDRILVLDQGRVVGFGTHAELLAHCATYQTLWNSQFFHEPHDQTSAAMYE